MEKDYSFITRFFYWLLSRVCKSEILEIVAGDLLEMHEQECNEANHWKADFHFALNVLSLFRFRLLKSIKGTQKLNIYDMFKHNLKVTGRNLLRNRSHAFLNIIGLSIGMACSILILLWITNEISYDRFHSDSSRIYRLTCNVDNDFKAAVSPAAMATGVKEVLPEISEVLRITKTYRYLLEAHNRQFEKQPGYYVDENFLDFFDFPLIEGDKEGILEDPYSILITQSAADRYFGCLLYTSPSPRDA